MAARSTRPAWPDELRTRVDELIEEYRATLLGSLDGLTEEEARVRLVPSKTTLLGLVKHVTYVEAVWFDQAITGRTLREAGVAASPDASFTLRPSDTVASVQETYQRRSQTSRDALATMSMDQVVTGRGERPVGVLLLQVLRELAQHAGHADILREQILDRRR